MKNQPACICEVNEVGNLEVSLSGLMTCTKKLEYPLISLCLYAGPILINLLLFCSAFQYTAKCVVSKGTVLTEHFSTEFSYLTIKCTC